MRKGLRGLKSVERYAGAYGVLDVGHPAQRAIAFTRA